MTVFHNSIGLVIAEDNDFIHLKIAKRDDVSFDLKGGESFVTLAFTGTDDHGLQMLPWEHANEVADNTLLEREPEPAQPEPEPESRPITEDNPETTTFNEATGEFLDKPTFSETGDLLESEQAPDEPKPEKGS